uniref:hypothetical protein n=1 Tax=Pseudofabraea citricarpa TaxID=1664388 RepID=UPI0022FD6198|nr:hypothetical protein PN052_mgp10 [Pseudofabraea citricarpa]WAX38796.1 hypothetical protein [Pseudofabraea citricarpa]
MFNLYIKKMSNIYQQSKNSSSNTLFIVVRSFSSSRFLFVEENGKKPNNGTTLPSIREVLASEFNNGSNQNNSNSDNSSPLQTSNDNSTDNNPNHDNNSPLQTSNENSADNNPNQDNNSPLQTSNENSADNNPNQDNNSPLEASEDNNTGSSDDGYGTDSNRSYFAEGTDAMVDCPADELAEDSLREFIKVTREIWHHPCEGGGELDDNDPANDGIRQSFSERYRELRQELRRRKEAGMVPNSPSESSAITDRPVSPPENSSDNDSVNVNDTVTSSNIPSASSPPENSSGNDSVNVKDTVTSSNIPSASSSTNKRKFEDDDGSSIQSSKRIKHDSNNLDSSNTFGTTNTNPDNQSPIDYVVEKQSEEMSDIYEIDGE